MPAPNPTSSDQYGNYLYYVGPTAAPNLYEVQLSPTSGVMWTYVVNGPSCSITGCTFTGEITAPIVNVTSQYDFNGSQVTCGILSDCGNLAKLNAANTFSASPQTAAVWNATSMFEVGGSQITSAALADAGNLAKLNATNVFTGTTNTFNAIVGTTIGGTVINATTGFEVAGGAGANGYALCSNGTVFNTACAVYSATNPPPAAFYQTVYANTVAQTQRYGLNFTTNFTLSDSSSPSETTVDLAAAGTAGTYTCPSTITTDSKGRVTAAANGMCPGSTTQVDRTGSRVWGSAYQNTSGTTMIISGYTTTPGGSATGNLTCMVGPSSPSLEVWGTEYTATVNNAPVAFFCIVPNTFYYSINSSGDIAATPSKWIETTVN
jgi:hypothetical protein